MFARFSLVAGLVLAVMVLGAGPVSAQDRDFDGVPNATDNCVDVANQGQDDADQDGRGDACECGDFTGDGFVNSVDARLVQRCAVGVIPCADLCDVTGEGECNSIDARLIQRFSVGQLVKESLQCQFPVPEVPFEGVECVGNLPSSECTIDVKGVTFVTTREKISVEAGGGSSGLAAANGAPVLPGIIVSDDLRLPTPVGELVLAEAMLEITVGPSGIGPFQTLVGTARVPFPDLGFLAGVQVDETPIASIGLDLGANIDVGVPLLPDRQFLFFDFSSTFGASLGPVSFSVGGPQATMVLDVRDPFFYVGGSLAGLIPGDSEPPPGEGGGEGEGGPDDFGFGISISGFIPFVPEITAGIEGQVGIFLGHLLVKAQVPFPPLPLTLDGMVIADIDPDENGTIFVLSPDLRLGGNGTLAVGIPFLKFLEFGFDLGTSTAAISLAENDISAFFSGVLDPDDPFAMFPPEFPIPIRQNPNQAGAAVAGGFSATDPLASFVRAEGEFSIDLGPLGDPIGVNLGEMAGSSVFLSINSSGLVYRGATSSQIIPNFTNAEMQLEVIIPSENVIGSSAELSGALTVAGLGLDPARIFVSPLGFEVEGDLDLSPVAQLVVLGGVDGSGVMLTGSFDTNIDFDLEPAIDDILFEARTAVSIAQDALDSVQVAIDGCKDLCPGGCYLNPCCGACEVTFEVPRLAAEAALLAAQFALTGAQEAVDLFFAALPFDIRGQILTDVDVTIDNANASGAVSASFFGLDLGGRARFFPPKICVTLPLGDFPGASTLGLGDEEFCIPPI